MIDGLIGMLLAGAAAPVPAASPGGWATMADYPAESLQAKQEGTVKFRLVVAKDGVPKECTIVQSSGHIPLDNRTCEVVMQRARFTPSGDGGYATTDVYQNQIRWSLPAGNFDPNAVTGDAPGFCGFGMSLNDPKATKFFVVQDQALADHDRILVTLMNPDWPIRSDDKIVEQIKVRAKNYSFWNDARAVDHGFSLMMDAKHVRKFIDSYPVTAAVYRGDKRVGVLSLNGLQKEYNKFTACVAKRSEAKIDSKPAS